MKRPGPWLDWALLIVTALLFLAPSLMLGYGWLGRMLWR